MVSMDYTWMFIRMLFALGAVTLLAVIILRYVIPKYLMPKKLQEGQFFKILARFHLGQRKYLYLVEAGKKTYILGVSDHNINLISEVENDEKQKIINEAISKN